MTMRLDIVTNDAGELVRREHARELGAGVVVAIYRLAKLAQLHDLANQAFTRQLEQTHQIIGDYCLRSGGHVNVLFAHKAVFVAGQLLKGSRGTYEAATELGELFERLGGSDLHIQRDITREELLAFAEQVSIAHRSGSASFRSPPKMRIRQVADAARLRGLELENLTADQRIVRMYASAVVIMRRFFEDLSASRYILPRRIKRIAQSLVELSEGSTPSFLGVTEVRNANFDEAGRAVNTAILAVTMAREVTSDRAVLSQIAMAGMMHDVSRPRALALMAAGGPAMPGMQGPTTLSEDQEDRLAAGAAAVLTALGRLNEPSMTRTVLAFEALWLRRQTWLGPVYWGARESTLHAKILTVARRYNDLLTPEPGLAPPTPDYAVAVLADELQETQDRTVLRMLVSALGLLPLGTVVQLATGEVAEVIRGPRGPGERPRVVILNDAVGQPVARPMELELANEPHRSVVRILAVDGWRKGLAGGPPRPGAPGEGFDPDDGPAEAPPQASASAPAAASRSIADQYADQYASWGGAPAPPPAAASALPASQKESSSSIQSGEHNSSASLPSLGSSPSAVAEAMGRMINDSLKPPAPSRGESDRTLFQGAHGASEEELADRVTSRPPAKGPREPTARGNLSATPLPHVLVYMLDHSLTGSVVFEGGGAEDTIYFVGGVPTKIKLVDSIALLGEILVHGGAIEPGAVEEAVEGARRLGILLGEYLVGEDLVTREALSWALEAQLLNKIAYLANLAPEITYAYYRDADLLEGWGGEDVSVGCPLNPILASVRNWMDRARVRATLNRIGKHPLVLHPDAALDDLALIPEERAALDVIRGEALPLSTLFKRNVADEEVVSSLVYSLAVTRQFAFKGQKKGPMAPVGASPWKAAASPSAPAPASPSPPDARGAPTSSSSRPNAAAAAPVAQAAAGGGSPIAPPVAPAASPAEAEARVASAVVAPAAQGAPARGSATGPVAPVSVRKLEGAPGPAPRAIAPAARPAQAGRGAPQIRPIAVKKVAPAGTPAAGTPAVPPETRAPATQAPATPATAGAPPAARTPGAGTPAAGVPAAGAARPAVRPPPGLPSKLGGSSGSAGMRPGSVPGQGAPSAFDSRGARPAPLGAKPAPAGPREDRAPAKTAPTPAIEDEAPSEEDWEIALDDGAAPPSASIDVGAPRKPTR